MVIITVAYIQTRSKDKLNEFLIKNDIITHESMEDEIKIKVEKEIIDLLLEESFLSKSDYEEIEKERVSIILFY